jgi:HK97 family phage major capsid protein
VFVRAIGALRRVRTRATAVYMNPATFERLSLLKKGADSNEPLISGVLAATDAAAESIQGVPVYQSEVIEADKAFVVNAAELVVVRRTDVEVEVDPHFKFANAGVGVRVIARAAMLPTQAKAVAMIEDLPTA